MNRAKSEKDHSIAAVVLSTVGRSRAGRLPDAQSRATSDKHTGWRAKWLTLVGVYDYTPTLCGCQELFESGAAAPTAPLGAPSPPLRGWLRHSLANAARAQLRHRAPPGWLRPPSLPLRQRSRSGRGCKPTPKLANQLPAPLWLHCLRLSAARAGCRAVSGQLAAPTKVGDLQNTGFV